MKGFVGMGAFGETHQCNMDTSEVASGQQDSLGSSHWQEDLSPLTCETWCLGEGVPGGGH